MGQSEVESLGFRHRGLSYTVGPRNCGCGPSNCIWVLLLFVLQELSLELGGDQSTLGETVRYRQMEQV